MRRFSRPLPAAFAAGIVLLAACDSSESSAPHGHDPVAALQQELSRR